MSTKAKGIPDGYCGATPYITVKNAAGAIDFYKKAFGATELMRIAGSDGKIGHAEIKIGNAMIMLSDEHPEMNVLSPETIGGSPVTLHLYVEDVDALAREAIAAGAKMVRPIENQFYGDRGGKFTDPYGHHWWFATRIEDVTTEEIKKRAAALYEGGE